MNSNLFFLEETESETLASYIEWMIIKNYYLYLSSDITDIFKNYNDKSQYPRNMMCLDYISSLLMMNIGKIFTEKAFSADDKKNIEDMVKNISESMNTRIANLSWLDEITKENAKKKAYSLIKEIGYPDFIMNPKELYEFNKGLEMDPKELFNNIINIGTVKNSKAMKQLETNEWNNEWMMSPIKANAYYNPLLNQYVFPAGIIQSPYYNSFNPNYLNYGGIGMIIGHELSHAF
ncbi:zincin, partial [Anaeromyces robustus]